MGSAVKIAQSIQTFLALLISLTTVLGLFTAIINKCFTKKLKPIQDQLNVHERYSLEKGMCLWRYEIVTFASELHNGIPKTIYEFEAIFKLIDEYDNAVKELHIKNSLFEAEKEFIRHKYQELKK